MSALSVCEAAAVVVAVAVWVAVEPVWVVAVVDDRWVGGADPAVGCMAALRTLAARGRRSLDPKFRARPAVVALGLTWVVGIPADALAARVRLPIFQTSIAPIRALSSAQAEGSTPAK